MSNSTWFSLVDMCSAQQAPIPDPSPSIFFDTHQEEGNPKYWVLFDILGKPEVSGIE